VAADARRAAGPRSCLTLSWTTLIGLGLGAAFPDQRAAAQLFDLVVDYPESRPALRDLAACLRRARLHGALAARFRAAIQTRLLHAGARAPHAFGPGSESCIRPRRAAAWRG